MRHIRVLRTLYVVCCLATPAFAAAPPSAITPASPSPAAVYQDECGSCHLAYPPRFLSSSSWAAVLDGLTRHFGQNARVEEPTLATLRAYLADRARKHATDGTGSTPALRITQTRWFLSEHRGMDRRNVWQRPSVGSPANCAACHVEAVQGKFGEHDVRVPK